MGGPIPDKFHDCDFNDDGLDHSVRGAEIFPRSREFKKLLDILRYKSDAMTQSRRSAG